MYSKKLINELKRAIKKNRYTYQDVASFLKMSESGFKKLINSEDCSINKIEKICHFLGLNLVDLFESIEREQLKDINYSKEQIKFFQSNWEGFLLYWGLVYERRKLSEMQDLLKIDTKKVSSLLRKLDGLDLLKVLPGNKITLPIPQGVKWVNNSEFVYHLYQKWGNQLLKDGIQHLIENDNGNYFCIRYLKMSESTWEEFKQELEKLEIKFSNKATQEMRMEIPNLKHIRWLTVADHESWLKQEIMLI